MVKKSKTSGLFYLESPDEAKKTSNNLRIIKLRDNLQDIVMVLYKHWSIQSWITAFAFRPNLGCVGLCIGEEQPANAAVNICSSNKCAILQNKIEFHSLTPAGAILKPIDCLRLRRPAAAAAAKVSLLWGWDVISAAAKWERRHRRQRQQLSRDFCSTLAGT